MQDIQSLSDRILAFMRVPPPEERIFRRHELDGLGPPEAVGEALQFLARTHKAGSPARHIWFPLHSFTENGEAHCIPPAPLPDLGRALLRREGVSTRREKGVADYYREAPAGGVPTFMHIGVDQPAPLRLEWGYAYALTEYQGQYMAPPSDEPCSPIAIPDPDALLRVAARRGARVDRVEKDIWVNRALQMLGQVEPPSVPGNLYFGGGTSLTKGWQLTPRFSEDIDLRFQPPARPTTDFCEARQPLHAWLRAWLERDLLPHLPEGRINEAGSVFQLGRAVQRVTLAYASHFAPEPGTLKVEIAFTPFRVAGIEMDIVPWPRIVTREGRFRLARLPCVPVWSTMIGKLHALADLNPDDMQAGIMRHVVDLAAWCERTRSVGMPRALPAYMAQQCLQDGTAARLLDGLPPSLDALATHPRAQRLYREYVSLYFPDRANYPAPDWQTGIKAIQALWQSVCDSEWENPLYAVPVPEREVPAEDSGYAAFRDVDRRAIPPPTPYY